MGKPLLILAEEVEGEALATLVVNKLRGTSPATAPRPRPCSPRRSTPSTALQNADRRVVRAILEHLSLRDESRPPPVSPAAARAAVGLEYLPRVA